MKKKVLSIIFIVLIVTTSLYAQAVSEVNSASNETRIFIDSLGREVTLPAEIERVAPSGNVAQLALYAIAPEKMVGWSSRLSDSAMETFLPEVASLPVFGTFYGKKANLNREALIVADPQVVIDVGEIKGSVESMSKELDDLSQSIGIPVVYIEGYLGNTDKMFQMLGSLLGKEEEAAALAEYSRQALNKGEENKDKINTSIYYSSSSDGLAIIETGSFHGEVIEFIGAENVVPATFASNNGNTSLEQIYLWNPNVILLSNPEAYNLVTTDKAWGELDAVKNGRVYLIPNTPYSFLDSPPATNRIIGIYWLGNILAPDVYTEDISEKVAEYYNIFYHKTLTETEINTILNK